MTKRIVEKNERIKQIRVVSLNKKPTTINQTKTSQTPIKVLAKSVDNRRAIVSRQMRPKGGRERPAKLIKQNQIIDPKILIDIPSAGTKSSVQYPTPQWFTSTDKADVSVIIPLYKSQDVIVDLINNYTFDSRLNVELIFVDDCCPNNSKDVVLKTWNKLQPTLKKKVGKIIYNTENKGYGVACNVGAEYATGNYLIFLNADTKTTPGWIEPMVRLFNDSKVGIVGNLQLKEGGTWHGTIDGAGSEWIWEDNCFVHIGRHSYQRTHLPFPYKPENAPKEIMSVGEREMVTGCCFAIKADLFKYIGGFNPNYRVGYWEDAELCLAVRELGYKIMFTPDSVVWHKLSHTNSGAHEYSNYNRNFFMNKWVNSMRIDPLIGTKRVNDPDVGTILINRRGAHGDVLVAAAVVPALKKKYPKSKIFFSTECRDVLIGNPHIDKVISINDISERMFQLYFNLDMVYEFRPTTPILTAYAEAVGVSVSDCHPYLATEPFPGLPENYVVIHAGKTSWVGRDWKRERFEELSRKLMDEGKTVISVGRGGDYDIPCDINLQGKTTTRQLAYVISKAKSFIGIDSFPMHIAQTFDVPGTCFFGCVDPKLRIYSSKMKGVTANNLSCLGCHHRKPTPCTVTNICEQGNQDCVNLVTIDNMLQSLNTTL